VKTIIYIIICLFICAIGRSAILLDGIDDQITLGNKASMNITGPITMMTWIKTSSTGYSYIIQAFGGSPFPGYGFGLNITTKGKYAYYNGTTVAWVECTSTTVTNGQWHHIAVSVSASGGVTNAFFYLDGVADGSPTTAFPSSFSGDRFIGSTGVTNLSATIMGMGIFDKALTANEINMIYKSRQAILPVIWRPVCYWPMINVPSGSTCNNQIILDLSANNNNGVGDDGAGNAGITSVAETILSYP